MSTKSDSIRSEHQRLKARYTEARNLKADLGEMMRSPALSPALALFRREIEDLKEALVGAEPKIVVKIQAEVTARRSLLATLQGAHDAAAEEAHRCLAEFETRNALLLTGHDVDENTGEILDGTNR